MLVEINLNKVELFLKYRYSLQIKNFDNKRNFRRHMRAHHNIEVKHKRHMGVMRIFLSEADAIIFKLKFGSEK